METEKDIISPAPATIEACIRLANDTMEGQTDLNHLPAIYHSLQVGMMGRNREEQMTGFLHDVLEDSNHPATSLKQMRDLNVDPAVIDAVLLLTREESTEYFDYIRRIIDSKNELAIRVKYNDLQNNLKRGRAGNHVQKVEKYEKALARLLEAYPQLKE